MSSLKGRIAEEHAFTYSLWDIKKEIFRNMVFVNALYWENLFYFLDVASVFLQKVLSLCLRLPFV